MELSFQFLAQSIINISAPGEIPELLFKLNGPRSKYYD